MNLIIFVSLFVCILSVGVSAQPSTQQRVQVSLVTDEPDAVLSILEKRNANQPISDADWQRVFQTQGYVRLKQRETSMRRSFEDTDFKTFVLSNDLARRRPTLTDTLARWKRVDISEAARLALAYLPKEAAIRAKIYPVIKPRENSFVFDVKNDPAIFLYLDPAVGPEKFQNTLAHELHHIGYGSSCPGKSISEEIAKLPSNKQTLLTWIGAFGEGFAMLAAAGGPNIHPHAVSKADERTRWDKDVPNFNSDLKKVEKFFLDIIDKKMSDEEVQTKGFSFFGTQGPWYTVGWKMSVVIEKEFGRARLIDCFCDQRKLLPTYNAAASRHNRKSRDRLELWSPNITNAVRG